MKRRLKITVTKISRQTGQTARNSFRAVCPVCGREVELLTRAESIGILEIEDPLLEILIAAGAVHTTETASGSRRICKESLLK